MSQIVIQIAHVIKGEIKTRLEGVYEKGTDGVFVLSC